MDLKKFIKDTEDSIKKVTKDIKDAVIENISEEETKKIFNNLKNVTYDKIDDIKKHVEEKELFDVSDDYKVLIANFVNKGKIAIKKCEDIINNQIDCIKGTFYIEDKDIDKIDEIENEYMNSTKDESSKFKFLDSSVKEKMEKFITAKKIFVLNTIEGIRLTAKSIKNNYSNQKESINENKQVKYNNFRKLFNEYQVLVADMNLLTTPYNIDSKEKSLNKDELNKLKTMINRGIKVYSLLKVEYEKLDYKVKEEVLWLIDRNTSMFRDNINLYNKNSNNKILFDNDGIDISDLYLGTVDSDVYTFYKEDFYIDKGVDYIMDNGITKRINNRIKGSIYTDFKSNKRAINITYNMNRFEDVWLDNNDYSINNNLYIVNCKLDKVTSCYLYMTSYRSFKLQMAPINDKVITDKQLQKLINVYTKKNIKVKTK